MEVVLVEATGCVTSHQSTQGVGNHHGSASGTAINVQASEQRQENHHNSHHQQLAAGAYKGSKQREVLGAAEHIAMDLLPAAVFANGGSDAVQVMIIMNLLGRGQSMQSKACQLR